MPELYEHQQRALALTKQQSLLLGADPGCGKTAVGVLTAEYRKAHPVHSGKTLVVAPLSLLETAWAEDCAKFSPGLKFRSLWAPTPAKRKKVLADSSGDILAINYEDFKKIVPWLRNQKFDNLIIDESSALANPRSQITKVAKDFSASIPFKYCFSGTPMPNGPLDVWGQMAVVNPSLLGWNYWNFRSQWAYQTGYMGYRWAVTPDKQARLMQTITPSALFLAKEDCLDLPEQTFTTRAVYMDAAQREAYDAMVRDKLLPLVDGREAIANNILAELMKLRQITSGWVRDDNGKDYGFSNSKALVLDEVLAELGEHQAVIWVEFIHDAEELASRLGDRAVKIMGGLSPKELTSRLNAFKNGEKQYLVAHPATIGHGVTLTNASYMIFYSLSYSWQRYTQCCARIHRISQHHPCTYVHLLCRKTIDEVIYRALQRKDDMARSALSHLKDHAA